MGKVIKPVNLTQRVWDRMSRREKEFIVEHERMHEKFRQRAGYGHMSAEELFQAIMEQTNA
jgi:hypothetical protein